jgi:hypothetical protein
VRDEETRKEQGSRTGWKKKKMALRILLVFGVVVCMCRGKNAKKVC